MTFVKDNKMWLIKDVSVILKSKGEFFWKGFIIYNVWNGTYWK